MKLSPSWEAANCAATRELNSILWNPEIHHRIHINPPSVPILSQTDPIPTIPSYLSKIHFNIVHPSTSIMHKIYFEVKVIAASVLHTSEWLACVPHGSENPDVRSDLSIIHGQVGTKLTVGSCGEKRPLVQVCPSRTSSNCRGFEPDPLCPWTAELRQPFEKIISYKNPNVVQTGSGAHPAFYVMGTEGFFPESKAAGVWSWPLTAN
jgi:hypothetical protein